MTASRSLRARFLQAPPPAPSDRPALHRARLRVVEARNLMLEQLGPWLTAAEVAEQLGVAPDERQRQRKGLLNASFGRGDIRYPSFQFRDGALARGMSGALKALSSEDQTFQLAFFAEPRTALNGYTPKAAVEEGDGAAVEKLARAVTAPHG